MCFFLKILCFSELCQFCSSAGVLPAWCVYTHWHRGKREKSQSPEYFKILRKNTIFNEHPVSDRHKTLDWKSIRVKDTSSQKYPFLFSTNKNKLNLCNSWNGKALKASSWSFYYNRKNMETKEVVLVKAFQKMLVCFLFSCHNFIFV